MAAPMPSQVPKETLSPVISGGKNAASIYFELDGDIQFLQLGGRAMDTLLRRIAVILTLDVSSLQLEVTSGSVVLHLFILANRRDLPQLVSSFVIRAQAGDFRPDFAPFTLLRVGTSSFGAADGMPATSTHKASTSPTMTVVEASGSLDLNVAAEVSISPVAFFSQPRQGERGIDSIWPPLLGGTHPWR